MATYTFDPRRFLVYVGNEQVTSPSDGATSVEKANEVVIAKVGIYGDVMRSVSASRLFNISLKLMASSPSNATLQAYADADATSGEGVFAVRIVDINDSAASFTATQAWVSKVPKLERGTEATENEWTLQAGDGKLSHQGAQVAG